MKGGKDVSGASDRRSLTARESLIMGLFCGKWHPVSHDLHISMDMYICKTKINGGRSQDLITHTHYLDLSHVARVKTACHSYESVLSHVRCMHLCMNGTRRNKSCHTCAWGMSHAWMIHDTRMKQSCHCDLYTYLHIVSFCWYVFFFLSWLTKPQLHH